jgi:uncharacterized protein YqgV (UPF0045/DUF77 family)
MNSALAIQCLPQGIEGKENVYRAVDKAIEAIEASGLPYTVGAFETVVEGPLDQLFALAQAAHLAVLVAGAPGVATYMKLFSAADLGSTAKYRKAGH